jgi:hypothetical protein
MATIGLDGSLFTQRQVDISAGKLELLCYPWFDSSPLSLANGRTFTAAPIVVSSGTGVTQPFSANISTPLPERVVFAVRYKPLPVPEMPGVPVSTSIYDALLCRTGVVRAGRGFVPSEIKVYDLPSPTGFNVASMSDMVRNENLCVGVLPGADGITVANNQLVCDVQLYGWLGTMSGAATLYFTLKPAKVPHPTRFLDLALVDAKGIGLTKGAFLSAARKQALPGIQASLDRTVSEEVEKHMESLDQWVEGVSGGKARIRARGVMLKDFHLAATITPSFYISYVIA